ncbi:MAG: type IV secretion system DNA-binding domain-containing protein [Candidatus Pacebacteria bacterium]|nr:type IV secretion system DNA-binding domain-containing protein [Candidatus Paceibacterota bacterium]
MDIPRKPDLTYLAKTHYRDVEKTFGIKRADRRQHMYILGKSGTGKSALLTNMIVQNIANGEGLAVVDPHGELIEDILKLIPKERMDDVVYFNPADNEFHTGFNMLEVPDPKYKHLIASGLMGIFTKIWANVWSSRMEYILNNTILALIETPGTTMLSIPRMLVDTDYRNFIVGNVTDPVVKSFWTNEFEAWNEKFRNEAIAPIQNKVGQFLSTSLVRNIVGQEKSTIDIYEIMNTKKILLVNVSKGRIGEDNSALLGAMMITKIQLAAMERVRIPESERKDFYLYVDEFQNFVTESFASILSEARKYRLCLTVAHQYIGQLSTADSVVVRDAVFGNVGSMIIFRIGATDAEFIEKEFEPEFTAQDFVNLPNYHIYLKLMIDGVTSRPFSAKTLPPFRSEGSREIEYQIIERAQNLYARPRADVERDISAWSNKKIRPSFDNVPSDPDEVIESPDGKFRIKCSLFDECGNIAEVPFKPEKGRPVYCKEHIQKMKDAEGETPKEIPLISTPKNKEGDRPRIKIKEPVHLSSPKTSPAPASQKPLPKKQQTSIVTPSSKSNQEEPAPFVPKNNFKKRRDSFFTSIRADSECFYASS